MIIQNTSNTSKEWPPEYPEDSVAGVVNLILENKNRDNQTFLEQLNLAFVELRAPENENIKCRTENSFLVFDWIFNGKYQEMSRYPTHDSLTLSTFQRLHQLFQTFFDPDSLKTLTLLLLFHNATRTKWALDEAKNLTLPACESLHLADRDHILKMLLKYKRELFPRFTLFRHEEQKRLSEHWGLEEFILGQALQGENLPANWSGFFKLRQEDHKLAVMISTLYKFAC